MENALKQYLTLFKEHRQLIFKHSPQVLNELREKAYESLKDCELPKCGTENYEITDMQAMLEPDYGLNLARISPEIDPTLSFHCGVPHLSSALFFMINDSWAESNKARVALPEGVEIGSLASWMNKNPEFGSHYGKIADMANPIVALNTMFAQDGLYLRVKKGVRVEKPIQLVNVMQSLMPLMAVRRLLIEMEEDSSAKLLICDHTQNHDLQMMSLEVSEIHVGKGASLDIYSLEESNLSTNRLNAFYLRQEADSHVIMSSITLYNGKTRNEYHTVFEGERASLCLYGLGIEDKDRVLDNYSHIDHKSPRCHTDELFKYVVDDTSKGSFIGTIYVAPGAVQTEAYQNNRNLVGSDGARMYSKPQLEIYNDDVKCSHGSATGQLDQLQIFYMRSRGLSEDEAKLLLKQAFMADVVDSVSIESLRDRLHLLVERRFAGEDASCGDCSICR